MQNKKRRYNQDRDEGDKPEDPFEPLKNATTLYVGNLCVAKFWSFTISEFLLTGHSSFYTTEEQIHELFSK